MRRRLALRGVVFALALASGCCHSAVEESVDGGRSPGGGDAGGIQLGHDGGPGLDAGPTGPLTVAPAQATLTVQNGVPAQLQLQAMIGGRPVAAGFSSSRGDIAAVAPSSGLVTAAGPRGGTVTITATANGETATAAVSVDVDQTIYAGTLPAVASLFSGAPQSDPTHSPSFLYPSDQVVIPVNLPAMDYQWQGGSGNDSYRLTFSGPFATLVAYVSPKNPTQPDWTPDDATWRAFAQSNLGATITIDLAAASSANPGAVYGAAQQKLTLAASRFAGTIYYWTVSPPGEVLRISAGASTPQSFYTPPPAPAVDGAPTDQCMACHVVSPDGTKMAAELWNGGVPGSGTILDLTQSPALPLLAGGQKTWMFSAFDATGRYLLTSLNGTLTLRDGSSGEPVPAGSGEGNQAAVGLGDGGTSTQPTWSRDGQHVVFVQGVPGDFSWDVTFTASDLDLADWSPDAGSFGNVRPLVASDFDGVSLANFYPSVSVDGRLTAFSRSSCTYNCDTNDGLYVVPTDGGTPVELKVAEGQDLRNRYPNFSPFHEGGYQWLAFFSMRDYGWVTKGQGQRQVWITAIDDPAGGIPTVASDPSHPGFWLPGQDPTTMNDKAEWATLPCVGQGQGCQGDIDCC
ncbi:MAG: TolB family protein, partial [Deltaproteobacteria bacterium]